MLLTSVHQNIVETIGHALSVLDLLYPALIRYAYFMNIPTQLMNDGWRILILYDVLHAQGNVLVFMCSTIV